MKKTFFKLAGLIRLPGIYLLVLGVPLQAVMAAPAEPVTPGQWWPAHNPVAQQGVRVLQEVERCVGYCDDGDWVAYGPLQLTDGLIDRMEIKVAAPETSGRITVHLDQPEGPQIAVFRLVETGGYQAYGVQQAHVEQWSGIHRVVMVFRDGENLGNLAAFRFLRPSQEGTPGAVHFEEARRRRVEDFPAWFRQVVEEHRPAIEEHRTTMVTVQTRPGAEVRVRQVRHAFPFGTAINRRAFDPDSGMAGADRQRYRDVVKANFNSAVHENALKWYATEKVRDQHTFESADRMLDWCTANGLSMRGHCVYWGRENLVQPWVKALDDDALREKLHERARMVMRRYRGRIAEYDVNNEMVHCHYFRDRLGSEIRPQMFAWCHTYDPDAVLYVNDYSILTGDSLGAYMHQIRGFLDAGVPVGGIGVQGHFGGRVDGSAVKAALDKLAGFGLPVKITELDINNRDEYLKAEGLVTAYVTAFAHPAVAGIMLWGFWEGAHWRPAAALWRQDWTETLAARCHRDLVFKEWWTDFSGRADAQGTCRVRVFFGDHDVTAGETTRRFSAGPGTSAAPWSLP